MLTYHIESAFPSLLCLVILFLIPKAARKSLALWRALQVYDTQACTSLPEKKAKPSALMRTAKIIGGLVPFALVFCFMATAGSKLHDQLPLLGAFREAVPYVILFAMVTCTIAHLCSKMLLPVVSVGRRWNEDKEWIDVPFLKVATVSLGKAKGIFYLLILAACSATIICITRTGAADHQSAIFVAATSGFVWVASAQHTPLVFRNSVSFRGMLMLPAIFYAIVLVAPALVFVIDSFTKSDMSAGAENDTLAASDWGFSQIMFDLPTTQLIAIYYPFLWTFQTIFPTALILLAYRYDVAQEGNDAVSKEDATQILANSLQPHDVFGRRPVQLCDAALPAFTLSSIQLPTYNAALATMLGVQLVGTMIDVFTGWQTVVVFPSDVEQLPLYGNGTVSVWPLLSYPLVLVAMLVSVSFHPDRSFKSLWTFSEEWNANYKPSLRAETNNSNTNFSDKEAKMDCQAA